MNAIGRGVHELEVFAAGADVSKPDWTVRIVAVPPGEAPLWVREQWVGLDLPVARYSGHRKFLGLGVLSMPRSWWVNGSPYVEAAPSSSPVMRSRPCLPSEFSAGRAPRPRHGGTSTHRI